MTQTLRTALDLTYEIKDYTRRYGLPYPNMESLYSRIGHLLRSLDEENRNIYFSHYA
jgi:hypothetical protein